MMSKLALYMEKWCQIGAKIDLKHALYMDFGVALVPNSMMKLALYIGFGFWIDPYISFYGPQIDVFIELAEV